MMDGMCMRRVLVIAITIGLLAGCARSRVVRQYPHKGGAAHTSRTALPPVRVSQPKYGATALVQRGQTVYRIATENGITALDLALWNDIPPPYVIHPGQRLRLYPRDGREVATAPSTGTRAPAASAPRPSASTPVATPPAPATAPSSLAWRWPADGGVATTFVSGDPTRQGVDIAGKAGQPVRAAADGVVVYSGSGLVGYGELVIVKHTDQWLSAYGHNRARLVNEGALVKAGQQIAEMGRSGATRDMLHFEIRYNGKPVDPLLYLPKR